MIKQSMRILIGQAISNNFPLSADLFFQLEIATSKNHKFWNNLWKTTVVQHALYNHVEQSK